MAMNGTVKVISNDTGFAKNVRVSEGTTVGEVFSQESKHGDPDNYTIKLKRASAGDSVYASRDDVVHDGDMVIITPKNLKGNA